MAARKRTSRAAANATDDANAPPAAPKKKRPAWWPNHPILGDISEHEAWWPNHPVFGDVTRFDENSGELRNALAWKPDAGVTGA